MMRRSKGTRILSMLLAVILTFGLLLTAVFAEDDADIGGAESSLVDTNEASAVEEEKIDQDAATDENGDEAEQVEASAAEDEEPADAEETDEI